MFDYLPFYLYFLFNITLIIGQLQLSGFALWILLCHYNQALC